MILEQLLNTRKDSIIEKWLQHTLASYPLDGAKFLKGENDRFNNPVGYTIAVEIKNIYEELLGDMNREPLGEALEKIIRIRNVQEFAPSQAIGFIYLLKKAIRDELRSDLTDTNSLGELLVFEAKIDQLALLAFDIYTKCRQNLYEIRVNEIKRQSIHFLRQFAETEASAPSRDEQES
jgi:hypothetical protein